MNIGNAAERSGVSAKMIRYYEEIGLITASRRANGYRDYDENDVSVLQFIRRTRDLGFSLDEVSNLLALWRDRKRPSREVKRLASQHIEDLERRMREMRAVVRTLKTLADHCRGDERSECPILEDFASAPVKRRTARKHAHA
ncbi:MAG: Cu(I)-responsive transcriptional regulator [Terricaulis sp.]